MDWLPNFNQSNIVIALRAALAAAAILYVLEIYDIKNGMGHLGFLAVVLSCFAKPIRFIAALAGYGEAGALGARDRDEATIAYWRAHPTGHYRELHIIHHAADAFATATVVGAIEGVCRDMLKSADVVPNLLLLFPPAPAATIPVAKRE